MTVCRIRHFLQDLLPSLDAVIYLDVDTLVLQPLDSLWEEFYSFSDEQLMSMLEEKASLNRAAYNLMKSAYHSRKSDKYIGT